MEINKYCLQMGYGDEAARNGSLSGAKLSKAQILATKHSLIIGFAIGIVVTIQTLSGTGSLVMKALNSLAAIFGCTVSGLYVLYPALGITYTFAEKRMKSKKALKRVQQEAKQSVLF